jgi:hypothetical protein
MSKIISLNEEAAQRKWQSLSDKEKVDALFRQTQILQNANHAYSTQLGNLAKVVPLERYVCATVLKFQVKKAHEGQYMLPAGPYILMLDISGNFPDKEYKIKSLTIDDKEIQLSPSERLGIMHHLEKYIIWI